MTKFWNWIRDEDTGGRILRLEGPVDEDDFWGDSITPKAFREELEAEDGDITVWINSPGGSVFAAAEIYTMLLEYKGTVTVKIASIAASAASVIAMAGSTVLMSPTGMLMLHDPSTIAAGNAKDLEKAIGTLNEVKESIINAYQRKTGLSRNKIAKIMEEETWLNAKKAVQLGFADAILFTDAADPAAEESGDEDEKPKDQEGTGLYSTKRMGRKVLNRLCAGCFNPVTTEKDNGDGLTEEDMGQAGEGVIQPQNKGNTDSIPDNVGERRVDGTCFDSSTLMEALDVFSKKITESVISGVAAAIGEVMKTVPDDGMEEKAITDDVVGKSTSPVSLDITGKTADGAVPYEILKKQLDFLR